MFFHHVSGALRSIRRSPYLAAINTLSLALGLACFIGAYAAILYMESSDRHFATADRTYAITQHVYSRDRRLDTGARPSTSPILAKFIAQEFPELDAVARADQIGDEDVHAGEVKAQQTVVAADADFLRIFPFELQAGTLAALSSPRSAVLTAEAAQRLFGTANPLGKTVTLRNTLDLKVAAVIRSIPSPSQFATSPVSVLRFDMLVSWGVAEQMEYLATGRRLADQAEAVQWGRTSGLTYVLLPASGVLSPAALNNRLRGLAGKYVPEERRATTEFQFAAVPASQIWKSMLDATLFKGGGLSVTWLLQVLGGLVLAVGCLNYASLTAARVLSRTQETGLRKVLGARAAQVALQSILEASVIALAALCVALLGIAALTPAVRTVSGIDMLAVLGGDPALWIHAGGSILAAGLIAGSYPAIVLAKVRPGHAIRREARGRAAMVTRVLVGGQFAAASLLLIAATVTVLQSRELREAGLGVGADRTVIITNGPAASDIGFETLRAELARLPGVESVSIIDRAPWGASSATYSLQRELSATAAVSSFMHKVSPGFESALNMQMLAGRSFDASRGDDLLPRGFPLNLSATEAQRAYSVIIDRDLANDLGWSQPQDAVDRLIYIPRTQMKQPALTVRVIGVVENKPLRLVGFGTTSNIFSASADMAGYPIVRIGEQDVGTTLAAIDSTWKKLVPTVPMQRRFMEEQFETAYLLFERIGRVITMVTALAFLIALTGLSGMALFIANGRRHEIGVRKTLGASIGQVLRMLLRDLTKPVVIANIAVWPLAYVAANTYLSMFTHRISLTPLPFLVSLCLTVLIAWLAVGSQALRAARLKPARVLRYE